MRDNLKRRRLAEVEWAPLSPERAVRMRRRVTLLLGFVPLSEMSPEETDWVFRHLQRVANDE